jgi:hypothetical protein
MQTVNVSVRTSGLVLRLVLCMLLLVTASSSAQSSGNAAPDSQQPAAGSPGTTQAPVTIRCESTSTTRIQCDADTSSGVVLASSFGGAACLLGRTWGYDDTGIWVSDGCAGEFVVGQTTGVQRTAKTPEYVPNAGFLLYDGEKGQVYFRLFSYVRYLNQRNIDESYTDASGVPHTVQQRQDIQLAKFFAPFSGWFLTPQLRYYLYVWSSNASQGDPAQVVGGGNLSYSFNRFVVVGGGIASLPTVRSTEGQFPYWLGVDGRLIADEFFRGSYTNGVWVKGDLFQKLKYNAMFATNLSILGVSASQIDNKMDTQSFALQWLPTTGEFGLFGTFGDFDYHEKVATRVAAHWSHSLEDKQSQPNTNGIENSQVRLTDGSVVFTPDLFGKGVTVNNVDYQMTSVDAGVKYKGLSLEGEYYWRTLTNFAGVNTGGIPDISDTGYQLQSSAMAVKDLLQVYLSGSQIFGDYGDPSEVRVGGNWYFKRERGLRLNGEYINVKHSPVGYTAYPMPVGANGNIFHINLEMSF